MVMLVLAVAALVVPLVGLGRRVAAASPANAKPVVPSANAVAGPAVGAGAMQAGRAGFWWYVGTDGKKCVRHQ